MRVRKILEKTVIFLFAVESSAGSMTVVADSGMTVVSMPVPVYHRVKPIVSVGCVVNYATGSVRFH